jgi:hypothetical protein
MRNKKRSGPQADRGETVVAVVRGDDKESVGVTRESGRNEFGEVIGEHARFQLEGPGSQGESDTLFVCETLVNALNSAGVEWPAPRLIADIGSRNERGEDCESCTDGQRLAIQVVKADSDGAIWRDLNVTGAASGTKSTQRVVQGMLETINVKAGRASAADRGRLLLALDATRVPMAAMAPAVEAFRKQHGRSVRSLGFASVWVVGPTLATTRQLDVDGPAGM